MSSVESPPAVMTVLVYSDDVTTRERVLLAVGARPVADLPSIDYIECATHRAVIKAVDAGGIDVLILDGEAVPSGGMGSAGNSRTRSTTARRFWSSPADGTTRGWPRGRALTPRCRTRSTASRWRPQWPS